MIDPLKQLGQWNATEFFIAANGRNRLAREWQFKAVRVSGLGGMEEAVSGMMENSAFLCIEETGDGFIELGSPRSSRIVTVYMIMRHLQGDMADRTEKMRVMREYFRQLMTLLVPEKQRLSEVAVAIDPRINFSEMEPDLLADAVGAFFQIRVDVYENLVFDKSEWYGEAE